MAVSAMSDATALGLAVILLLGNAFFVGAEFALVSARRTQIEPRAERGGRAARLTVRGMEDVWLMMAGAQLGITMCSLGLGAVGEPALAHLIAPAFDAAGVPAALLHPVAFTIALAVVVTLHMVLGEMVPKNLAIAGPERAALLLGPPLYVVVAVLRPAVVLLNAIADLVLRVLRVQARSEVVSAFTTDEVAGFVYESRREGLLGDDEVRLIEGALGFTDARVDAVVLRPEELESVGEDVSVQELHALCARTGFSRFPVRDGAGDLTAYVHLKDVLELPPDGDREPVDPRCLRPLVTVAAELPLRDALAIMQSKGAHMARVVDADDRRQLGVATLEDVLEQLVGEVVDAGQMTGSTPNGSSRPT
jgi:CBS domain containing-hemolysin-like protein